MNSNESEFRNDYRTRIRMNSVEIEWFDPTDVPDEMNPQHKEFSVDVFIHCTTKDENTIGWFDYKENKWHFLCRESQGEFRWRYINPKIDKYDTSI